jgi:hypothetical protein
MNSVVGLAVPIKIFNVLKYIGYVGYCVGEVLISFFSFLFLDFLNVYLADCKYIF